MINDDEPYSMKKEIERTAKAIWEATLAGDNLKLTNIAQKTNFDGWTALMIASQKNNLDGVKILLKYKADCNLQDRRGDSALHLAAINNHKEVVKELLLGHADPNLRNRDNKTALDYARSQKAMDCVRCLAPLTT